MPAKPTFPVEYLFVNVSLPVWAKSLFQITHGFPVDPNPLFLSSAFPIENRPGLHDQSLDLVIKQLSTLLKSTGSENASPESWSEKTKTDIGKWLSDWHLLAFICMQGLLSLVSILLLLGTAMRNVDDIYQEEQKLLCRAATSHAHPDDFGTLDELYKTSGWQTLLTIVQSTVSGKFSTGSHRNCTLIFIDSEREWWLGVIWRRIRKSSGFRRCRWTWECLCPLWRWRRDFYGWSGRGESLSSLYFRQ